jgi:hypothetical protein
MQGKDDKYIKYLFEKQEGKRQLGRHNRRWQDKIRMDLSEIGWKGVNWMHLAQDKNQWRDFVNMVMNLCVT